MEYEYVESSIISNIGYDHRNKVLEIKLKRSNQIRHYLNFPEGMWRKLKKADSIGKFFLKRIRYNYDELRFAKSQEPV